MDLREAITDILSREGITQKELAKRAGVDQATVSRAARRLPRRRTTAHAKLCKYMQLVAPTVSVPSEAIGDALRETWDGSDAHAAALAELIRASRELWPQLGKEEAP